MRASVAKCFILAALLTGVVYADDGPPAYPGEFVTESVADVDLTLPAPGSFVTDDTLMPTDYQAEELFAASYEAASAPSEDSLESGVSLSNDIGQPYDLPVSDVIPEQAELYSTNDWFRGGRWYSKQEFVMLLRTEIPDVHIAVDSSANTSNNAFLFDPFVVNSIHSKDAGFTYEPGARISIGTILGRDVANRDHGIEFTFFGLFEYSGRASIEPANPNNSLALGINSLLASPEVFALNSGAIGFPVFNPVDGFVNSDSQEISYEADLNSFEVNYMIGGRPARDRLVMQPDGRWKRFATPSGVRAFYAGLRYIGQGERFVHTGRGHIQVLPIFDEDAGGNIILDSEGNPTVVGNRIGSIDERGTYAVETENDMVGFQFGGDIVQKRTDWVIGVNGKVGGLVNFSDRRSTLIQRLQTASAPSNDIENDAEFETTTTTQSVSDETLTFVAEANAYLAYYLRPNTSVRIGYNILFMNGVATSANNLGISGGAFPRFELTSDALYHGMNFGFEKTW